MLSAKQGGYWVSKWLRITLYVFAGVAGISGAAAGLSKGLCMLLIAAVAFPIVMFDICYRRTHGENHDA
jgi:hypothetical protein